MKWFMAVALLFGACACGSADPVADELCTFLETEAPALESVGTTEAALARFATDFAGWVAERPSQRRLDSAQELDAVTTENCADVRARVVTALGADSFGAALGR